jgi:SNF2 family DNA or RNA helicase
VENSLLELWSVLSLVAPGLLPVDPQVFNDVYRLPIERARDGARLERLRQRVAPLLLRRTKEQVAPDLPPRTEQVLEVELDPAHRRAYQALLTRERTKVLGLMDDLPRNRFRIFRSLTLLRQAALDVALADPDREGPPVPATKLDVLLDLVADVVAEGHRVLVFSQFTRFLTAARERLEEAGHAVCYLDGTTRRREEVVEAFRTGDAPVFLISLKAGGTGLTLTEADYCVVLDPWWNPATESQAVNRAHRIGQTRPVVVYRLVAKDTIEEKVMALKEAKEGLAASLLDGEDLASAALTADDLRLLVG